MSSYLAISGVTETLKSLLKNQMLTSGIVISSAPPDLEPSTKAKRVNLFLYKTEENAYLKNQEIPGQGYPAAYGQPPLSLGLYYLLTAFPEKDKYDENYDVIAHEILGDAMRVFHDYPILIDSMEVEITPGIFEKLLHTSLQNQFEKVKITLEPLDTEELTKIWMGLNSAYRLSAGYVVSVVQIESKKPRQLAQPVKVRQLHLIQLRRPQIHDLTVIPSGTSVEMPPATARIGDTLTIRGVNFVGVSTDLIIGDAEFLNVTPTSGSLIEFVIPDDPKLQPGPLPVGVRVKMATEVVRGGYYDRGEAVAGENIVTSNQMALMLVPKITNTSPSSGNTSTLLTVEGKRLFKEDFKAFVLVGDRAIEVRKPESTDPWDPPEEIRVQVPLTAFSELSPGAYTYLIRIRVNGAESLEDDKEFELTIT